MKINPKILFISFIVILFIYGFYSFYKTMFRDFHPVILNQPKIEFTEMPTSGEIKSTYINAIQNEDYLSFDVNDLLKYSLVKFNDPKNIISVPLISYLTSDGKIVTAISFSENCKSNDFYLNGKNIHCANCPSYWNKESLEAYACCANYYPQPINSKIFGNEVRIYYEVLEAWKPRQ